MEGFSYLNRAVGSLLSDYWYHFTPMLKLYHLILVFAFVRNQYPLALHVELHQVVILMNMPRQLLNDV